MGLLDKVLGHAHMIIVTRGGALREDSSGEREHHVISNKHHVAVRSRELTTVYHHNENNRPPVPAGARIVETGSEGNPGYDDPWVNIESREAWASEASGIGAGDARVTANRKMQAGAMALGFIFLIASLVVVGTREDPETEAGNQPADSVQTGDQVIPARPTQERPRGRVKEWPGREKARNFEKRDKPRIEGRTAARVEKKPKPLEARRRKKRKQAPVESGDIRSWNTAALAERTQGKGPEWRAELVLTAKQNAVIMARLLAIAAHPNYVLGHRKLLVTLLGGLAPAELFLRVVPLTGFLSITAMVILFMQAPTPWFLNLMFGGVCVLGGGASQFVWEAYKEAFIKVIVNERMDFTNPAAVTAQCEVWLPRLGFADRPDVWRGESGVSGLRDPNAYIWLMLPPGHRVPELRTAADYWDLLRDPYRSQDTFLEAKYTWLLKLLQGGRLYKEYEADVAGVSEWLPWAAAGAMIGVGFILVLAT